MSLTVGALKKLLDGVDDELELVAVGPQEMTLNISGVWVRGLEGDEDVVALVAKRVRQARA